ncbi:MAG: ATP-dependent sacrificial sulfur transferase LarE, partial [Dehalococcoidia bacterium]|nr:ATP-dependent sacrificial sulfur transferase LarE [Dehalococcoidia bacterium]
KSLAVIGVSPTYPNREVSEAEALAKHLGFRYTMLKTRELDDPSFVSNDSNRCYYCKTELFSGLKEIADKEGFSWVADGSNCDDLKDYRPGRKAAREIDIRSPLCEAGFNKAEIREASKGLGLPNWSKPAMACLASRFPYGTAISEDILGVIEQAEFFLHQLGAGQVRVRHHGTIARIEVDEESIPLLTAEPQRRKIQEKLKALGYTYVTLDLGGYRTGSMNDVLDHGQ